MKNQINNQQMAITKINSFFDWGFIGVWGVMFIVAANFLVVSLGGNGFGLPPNIAVWACIAVLILFSFYKILLTDTVILPKLLIPLLGMSALLVLPGLINTQVDTREILLRISQVIGFVLLFFALSQYQFSQKKINLLFYIVVFSALVQIVYVIAQKYHNPETTPAFLMLYLGINKPPVGGFLQVNALSMFLVTTIIMSLYLVAQESFKKYPLIAKLMLFVLMLGGGYVLALISSRAALLALSLSLPLMLFSSWETLKKKKVWVGLLVSGLLVGLALGFVLDTGINRLENKKMTSRIQAWSLSIDAIKEQPLMGHGIGGFSKAFFDQIENRSRNSTGDKVNNQVSFFTHPHNEILYWGVESGIAAVFAILSFLVYYLFLLFKVNTPRQVLQYLALLVPITLSTQVSLPFYLSSLLMVLFIFLLLLPFKRLAVVKSVALSEWLKKLLIVVFGVMFVLYIWFIKETIVGGITMTRYVKIENSPFSMLQKTLKNPYWGKVATNYAHQYMMKINLQQGKKAEARKYLLWFEDQLERDEEPLYYEIMLNGYQVFGEGGNYNTLREKAVNRYPVRFDHYLPAVKVKQKK